MTSRCAMSRAKFSPAILISFLSFMPFLLDACRHSTKDSTEETPQGQSAATNPTAPNLGTTPTIVSYAGTAATANCALSCSPACSVLARNLSLVLDRTTTNCSGFIDRGACLSTARQYGLSTADATLLCSVATATTSDCIVAASAAGLSSIQTGNVCQLGTNSCISAARNAGILGDQIVSICGLGASSTSSCITGAQQAGLSSTQIVDVCRTSNASTAACLTASSNRGLSTTQAASICKSALSDAGPCITATANIGLSSTDATAVCGLPASTDPLIARVQSCANVCTATCGAAFSEAQTFIDGTALGCGAQVSRNTCLTTASSAGMNTADTVSICSNGTQYAAACIQAGASAGLSSTQIATACQPGSKGSDTCIQTARNSGLSSTETANLCAQSTTYTATCISTASQRGFSTANIVTACTLASNQTSSCIIQNHQSLGTTETANACKPNGSAAGGIANPTNLAALNISESSINFTWNAAAGASGYVLALTPGGIAPTDCSGGRDVGNVLSSVVPGLNPATFYSLRLCARDSSNRISNGIILASQTLSSTGQSTADCVAGCSESCTLRNRNLAYELTNSNASCNSGVNISNCTSVAVQNGLNTAEANELCTVSTLDTPACIQNARSQGFSTSDIVYTCHFGTADCVNTARNYGLTINATAKLCAYNTPNTTSCITTSRNNGLAPDVVASSCQKALGDVGTCFTTALSSGLGVQLAATTCSLTSYGSSFIGSVQNCAGVCSPGCSTIFSKAQTLLDNSALACGSTFNRADCVATARNNNLSVSEIAAVCQNGTNFSSACIQTARQNSFLTADSVTACRGGSAGGSECINSARTYGLSNSQSATLCSQASRYSSLCISTAQSQGLSTAQITELCPNAAADIQNCINQGRQNGLSSAQTVTACKGAPSQSTPTPTPTGPPPPAVTNLRAIYDTDTSILITWSSGGGNTAGFIVNSAPGLTPPASCTGGFDSGSTNSVVFTSLQPNTDYAFRVCARSADYALSPSVTTTARTSPSQSPPPAFIAGAWSINGAATSVEQNGWQLVFINERGERGRGSLIGANRVVAQGWSYLYASVASDFTTISWENNTTWIRAAAPLQLAGQWSINGQKTTIQQNGWSLVFTNENGELANGAIISATEVVAFGWNNLRGTLTNNAGTINWANNSVWTKTAPPVQLAGTWFINSKATSIEQNGWSLVFTNEFGDRANGTILSATEVVATGWGNLHGIVANGATRINWTNNSAWTKTDPGSPSPSPSPSPSIAGPWTINGLATSIEQNGNTLVFINEHGDRANGVLNSSTQVTATGWGNLRGTLTNNATTINWANNSTWNKVATAPVQLAGSWRISGKTTTIQQNGFALVFTNEFGDRANGTILSATEVVATGWSNLHGIVSADAKTINWANNSTWTKP